jgi:hypothetical protein
MTDRANSFLLFNSLYQPTAAFEELSKLDPAPLNIMFRYSIFLLLLPPVFSLIGASNFGLRLGAAEPLKLPIDVLLVVSIAYFCVLLFGLLSTTVISRWMASTYGASTSFGRHLALITIVGEPLAVASAAQLYPLTY